MQADHTPLDILVLNEKGKPERPWLTIILDNYSRAVAGYFLSFQDPSAIQTSLVLQQAISKKATLIGKYVVCLKLSIPIREVISLQIIWSKLLLI